MSRKRKAPIRKVYADPKFKSEIISKFIKLWQPRLAVFVESEIWPNMIMQSSKQCKLILLNCRISKKRVILKVIESQIPIRFYKFNYMQIMIYQINFLFNSIVSKRVNSKIRNSK